MRVLDGEHDAATLDLGVRLLVELLNDRDVGGAARERPPHSLGLVFVLVGEVAFDRAPKRPSPARDFFQGLCEQREEREEVGYASTVGVAAACVEHAIERRFGRVHENRGCFSFGETVIDEAPHSLLFALAIKLFVIPIFVSVFIFLCLFPQTIFSFFDTFAHFFYSPGGEFVDVIRC